jgi:hypothetical protein
VWVVVVGFGCGCELQVARVARSCLVFVGGGCWCVCFGCGVLFVCLVVVFVGVVGWWFSLVCLVVVFVGVGCLWVLLGFWVGGGLFVGFVGLGGCVVLFFEGQVAGQLVLFLVD